MNSLNKTFIPTQNSNSRNWYIIDCKGQSLGRLATAIASLLRGKREPSYHPSVDSVNYIILINTNSIRINEDKKHYLVFNPGRPGHALRIKNVSDCLTKLAIERAVKRMLSETEAKRLMRRLKIYSDQNHIHQAQNLMQIDPSNIYYFASHRIVRTAEEEERMKKFIDEMIKLVDSLSSSNKPTNSPTDESDLGKKLVCRPEDLNLGPDDSWFKN